jgi:hypothetical protein
MLTMMVDPPLTEKTLEEHVAQLEVIWKARSKELADHEAALKLKADGLDVFEKSLTEWEWHLKQVDALCEYLTQAREDYQKAAWLRDLIEIENVTEFSVADEITKHYAAIATRHARSHAEFTKDLSEFVPLEGA